MVGGVQEVIVLEATLSEGRGPDGEHGGTRRVRMLEAELDFALDGGRHPDI
jgi:hypothetical protein